MVISGHLSLKQRPFWTTFILIFSICLDNLKSPKFNLIMVIFVAFPFLVWVWYTGSTTTTKFRHEKLSECRWRKFRKIFHNIFTFLVTQKLTVSKNLICNDESTFNDLGNWGHLTTFKDGGSEDVLQHEKKWSWSYLI